MIGLQSISNALARKQFSKHTFWYVGDMPSRKLNSNLWTSLYTIFQIVCDWIGETVWSARKKNQKEEATRNERFIKWNFFHYLVSYSAITVHEIEPWLNNTYDGFVKKKI